MTSSSEPGADASDTAESLQRLHPLSWLFVMISGLRQFAVPLVVLLFFGRGGDWQEAAALIGTIGITLVAVFRYFTYRYRVDADALVIRSGLFQRGVRHLPFQRIHNVELKRNLLHRAFGVAEVRIESATGDRAAEAQMQVLSIANANALVARIRGQERSIETAAADSEATTPVQASIELARCSTLDLVLLGFSSNRGWIVVGAIVGLLAQGGPGSFGDRVPMVTGSLRSTLSALIPDEHWILTALVLVLLASLLVRMLGVVLILLRYFDFRLSEVGRRIAIEAGLLTRLQSHTTAAKIQRWKVDQPWLLRVFERKSLKVETAARQQEGKERGIDALLPIGRDPEVDQLVQHWLPNLDWPIERWQSIHPRTWRRRIRPRLLLFAIGLAVLTYNVGASALLLLPFALLIVHAARRDAAFSGCSVDDHHVLWRSGWLRRRWQLVERSRIQAVRLRQSAFDRRWKMAHVDVDTAGARGGGTTLAWLAIDDARRLCGQLRSGMARSVAPEGRSEQHQHREHLESAEQHSERAEPDRAFADPAVAIGDLAQPRTEVGHGRDRGAEGG